jgi:hypothetical protein
VTRAASGPAAHSGPAAPARRRPGAGAATALALCLALGPGAAPVQAQREAAGPERLLRFGDELLHAGEHYRAITEYQRFASYYPEDPRAAQMPLRIALAYLYGGRPEQALQAASPLLRAASAELRAWAAYLRTRAYYAAGEYELALRSSGDAPEGPLGELVRRGRLLSLLRLGRREQALALLAEPGAAGLVEPLRESLLERLQGTALPGLRSPRKAALLSALLPGAGQLYAGRKRDALVAFLLNGLFIFGAVESFRAGNEGTGILLLGVESGWYAGNIASAASSARRTNELRLERYLQGVAGVPNLENETAVREAGLLLGVRIGL